MRASGSIAARRERREPALRYERPWRERVQLYVDLFADPLVGSALWPETLGGARTPAQAAALLEADIAHWQRQGFGPWLFFEAATGVFVGRGGLKRTRIAGGECVEVVYALRPDAWGRGYATEIALATLTRARELSLVEVVGIVSVDNPASRRVLEKAGLRFQAAPIEYAGLPHWLGRVLMPQPTLGSRTARAVARRAT